MAKGSIKIARRYAKSLAELYSVPELDSVQSALSELSTTWSENKELRDALTNPAFKINERIAASAALAEKIKASDQKFANFTCLLCESRRISEISQISDAFKLIVDEIKKMLSLKVTSAFEVSSSEKENFKSHIHKEFGSLASVEWDMDKDLIGGLHVKAGDKLLDSSVKGALQRLEESLLQK